MVAGTILDVAVLEETASGPSQIVVLDSEKVAIYKFIDNRWQPEQSFPVMHSGPWPRDMRGRLVLRQDHLFDIYCRASSAGVPACLRWL